jgi:xylulose-5-phosphate/fructose-6-phosphate phosphoketolase
LQLAEALIARGNDVLERHRRYVTEHSEDLPEIRDWVWTD